MLRRLSIIHKLPFARLYCRALVVVLLLVFATLCIFTGTSSASNFYANCKQPGLLCNFNTGGYTPLGGCATNCGNLNYGQANSETGYDQPVLQWLDVNGINERSYNFLNNNHTATVTAGDTIHLQLGFNSEYYDSKGLKAITFTNVTNGGAVSSTSISAPGFGGKGTPCINGEKAYPATSENQTYLEGESAYSYSPGYFTTCTPAPYDRNFGVTWIEPNTGGTNHIVRYQLHMTFDASISTAQTVCLRNHVTTAYHDDLPIAGNPNPQNDPPYSMPYSPLMGLMGAGRGFGIFDSNSQITQPMCFYIKPLPPPTVDLPPNFSVTASCDGGVNILGLNDPNDRGGGVYYYGVMYHNDSSGNPRDDASKVAFSGRGQGNLSPIAWPAVDNTDYGYTVQVGVSNINLAGTDDAWFAKPATPPGGPGLLTATVPPCYQATCTMTVVGNVPGGPANAVKANAPFGVTVSMTNTGPGTLPENIGGNRLSATGSGGLDPYPTPGYMGQGIPIGGTITATFQFMAPNNINNQSISMYSDYYNRFPIGPNCTGSASSFPSYQQFSIAPHAAVTSTSTESPTGITYSTGGTKVFGPDVQVTTTSWLTRIPYGSGASIVDGKYNNVRTYGTDPDDTFGPYTPPTIVAGDQYCANASIYPANGWLGPPGAPNSTVADPHTVTAAPNCFTVHNEPYVHALGADVTSGGGFDGGACSTNGGIKTLTKTTGTTPVGSGGMIAALARGQIEGFSSANLRGSAPLASTGLSFSNTAGAAGSGSGAPQLGGNLNGNNNCITNYFSKMPGGLSTKTANATSANGPGGPEYYEPSGGTLKINGGNINGAKSVAIYVKGNVRITNDITYNGTAACPAGDNPPCWASIDDIPSFVVVAVGGNIYIDPGVTQLDGTYISQPDSGGSGGTIYSCSNGTSAFSYNTILGNCNSKQLVVNGSFIANRVLLTRTFGSLRNSAAGERLGAANKNCGDSGNTPYNDCSAEIFNFSPETYLNKQSTVQKNGPTTGIYEYVTSLSPVL